MANLNDDKAFQQAKIGELLSVGTKTLSTANQVSKDVKDCISRIEDIWNELPEGAKDSGTQQALQRHMCMMPCGIYRK